jgi:hypothetical protein
MAGAYAHLDHRTNQAGQPTTPGLRKRGDVTPVADDDAFHIGSNTKGMTK